MSKTEKLINQHFGDFIDAEPSIDVDDIILTIRYILERILNRYPYMRDNADWHDLAALINGIRMMSFELEPGEEKPPTAATEDGQTGKSLENEYPSLF